MSMILMGIAAMIIGMIVGVVALVDQGKEMVQVAEEAEIVYCTGQTVGAVFNPCTLEALDLIPFTAGEIIELRHPHFDGSIMVFEEATKGEVMDHLSGMGYERLPGNTEGWVELPKFLRDEFNLSSTDPSEFTWEVYLYDQGIVAGFLSSDIEFERSILYIP